MLAAVPLSHSLSRVFYAATLIADPPLFSGALALLVALLRALHGDFLALEPATLQRIEARLALSAEEPLTRRDRQTGVLSTSAGEPDARARRHALVGLGLIQDITEEAWLRPPDARRLHEAQVQRLGTAGADLVFTAPLAHDATAVLPASLQRIATPKSSSSSINETIQSSLWE